jgi:hypothetical protein
MRNIIIVSIIILLTFISYDSTQSSWITKDSLNYNLLSHSYYENIVLSRSELLEYSPKSLTSQIVADLDLIDSIKQLLIETFKYYPYDSTHYFYLLNRDFMFSESFPKAYGNWSPDVFEDVLAEYDSMFNISGMKDEFENDKKYRALSDLYIQQLASIINVSNSIVQNSEKLRGIAFNREGFSVLEVYSKVAKERYKDGREYNEYRLMGFPYTFSSQELYAANKIGIRRLENYIHVFYPYKVDDYNTHSLTFSYKIGEDSVSTE